MLDWINTTTVIFPRCRCISLSSAGMSLLLLHFLLLLPVRDSSEGGFTCQSHARHSRNLNFLTWKGRLLRKIYRKKTILFWKKLPSYFNVAKWTWTPCHSRGALWALFFFKKYLLYLYIFKKISSSPLLRCRVLKERGKREREDIYLMSHLPIRAHLEKYLRCRFPLLCFGRAVSSFSIVDVCVDSMSRRFLQGSVDLYIALLWKEYDKAGRI